MGHGEVQLEYLHPVKWKRIIQDLKKMGDQYFTFNLGHTDFLVNRKKVGRDIALDTFVTKDTVVHIAFTFLGPRFEDRRQMLTRQQQRQIHALQDMGHYYGHLFRKWY